MHATKTCSLTLANANLICDILQICEHFKKARAVSVSLSAGVLSCYGEYFSLLNISREEIQLSVTAVKITAPRKTNLLLKTTQKPFRNTVLAFFLSKRRDVGTWFFGRTE